MVTVSVPGKVIIFGEHAVVYDKLGVAGAIDNRFTVRVEENESPEIRIEWAPLEPAGISSTLEQVREKHARFHELYAAKNWDEVKKFHYLEALQIVAFEAMQRMGNVQGLNIKFGIREHVKNTGFSAGAAVGVVLATSKLLGKELDKKEVSDIAYLADVIAHGGTPSGIDNSTVTFGGFITFRKSQGITPLQLDTRLPLLLVSSGDPAKTAVTVPAVRKLREQKPEFVDAILNEIDKVSLEGVEKIKNNDLKAVGELMDWNHELLRRLQVSTPKLDLMCLHARKNQALGAKMTGGGGGGSIIVLAKDEKHLEYLQKVFREKGYKSWPTKIGVEGVRLEA